MYKSWANYCLSPNRYEFSSRGHASINLNDHEIKFVCRDIGWKARKGSLYNRHYFEKIYLLRSPLCQRKIINRIIFLSHNVFYGSLKNRYIYGCLLLCLRFW